MISQIHVYPPLGVLTSVRKKLIRFRVYFVCCMEDEIRKVEIWTNMLSGSSWRGIELEELQEEQSDTTKNELIFLDQSQLPIGYRIKSFGLNTPSTAALTSRFEFTVRWRKNDQDDWRWISKVGQNARVVVFKDVPDLCHRPALNHWSQQLRLLLRKVKDPFSSDSDQPLTPVSDSWRASKTSASCIFKPQGKAEAGGTVFFGRLTDIERYLAFARKDKFWIIPKNGTDLSDLGDFEIVILVCELCNGTYAALMPFIKDDTRSMTITIKAEPRNMLHLLVLPQDVGAKTNGIRVAASASADMHSAVEEVFYRVHRSVDIHDLPVMPHNHGSQSQQKRQISLLDFLGYCTWNTFYQHVSNDTILSTLKDIKQEAISSKWPMPKWVMIDDGWQSVDRYDGFGKLFDIFANEAKFPGQLQHTVSELAKLGICRVGVWHALWGYWGGIDPNGPLAKRYHLEKHIRKASSVANQDSEVWLISSKDIYSFYDHFYKWLHSQGVSFVKVDYQCAFETLEEYTMSTSHHDGGSDVAELYSAYYDAMESAAEKYFDTGSIVYCMSHSPHLIKRVMQQHYYLSEKSRQIPLASQPCSLKGKSEQLDPGKRMLFRNSDDYYPDEPESHGWHIYCNVANSMWSRLMYRVFAADWDMFKPGRHESKMHSVSRIVSGGPVYITGNKSDYMDQDLLEAVGHGGRLFQCAAPLIDSECALIDCRQSSSLLFSSSASPINSSVLVFLANISTGTVISPIEMSTLYGTATKHSNRHIGDAQVSRPAMAPALSNIAGSANFYTIHQHSTGKVLVTKDLESIFAIALQPLTCDIVTVVPMSAFQSSDRVILLYAACIGDTARYGGANCVQRDVSSVLPDSSKISSPCTSARTIGSERYRWDIRAKVSLPLSKVAFAFFARNTASRSKAHPLLVVNVRVSGLSIGVDDWEFDNSTHVLSVKIPFAADSLSGESFTRVTVTISCSYPSE